MDAGIKWIGGATLAAVMLFGSAVVAGRSLEAESPRIAAEDVLDFAAEDAVNFEAPPPAKRAIALPAPAPVRDDPFVIKRVLPIDGPIRYGEWFWDEAGVPTGPLVITVDLEARVISVFRGGYEIGASAVLLGTDEYPTPVGTFPILSKERHNVSEKYNNAPMPWTMRLTRDGVAIHGGSTIANGYASHGCISAPDAFVSKLYAIAKPGDKVIITRGQMTGVGQSLGG